MWFLNESLVIHSNIKINSIWLIPYELTKLISIVLLYCCYCYLGSFSRFMESMLRWVENLIK